MVRVHHEGPGYFLLGTGFSTRHVENTLAGLISYGINKYQSVSNRKCLNPSLNPGLNLGLNLGYSLLSRIYLEMVGIRQDSASEESHGSIVFGSINP